LRKKTNLLLGHPGILRVDVDAPRLELSLGQQSDSVGLLLALLDRLLLATSLLLGLELVVGVSLLLSGGFLLL
jgi:hypothetical protein